MTIRSIEHVAQVERIGDAGACLLVEVSHGADRRAHYDALRSRLLGPLPGDLHVFFHANTDVGAWEYGRRVAERVVAARPGRAALLVRCLIPRTFVDANRREEATDDLARGGMTAGVAPYVRHPADVQLLLALHRAYVALIERAYDVVCGSGGFALSPHTYGPRTMGIERVDESIVAALRAAHEPEAWARWPVRPPVDVISRDAEGRQHAPPGMVERLLAAYEALGVEAADSRTYTLHPATQIHRRVMRWPDRVLGLEVRRDLLVEAYTPFHEMTVRPEAADRFAGPVALEIDAWLAERGR